MVLRGKVSSVEQEGVRVVFPDKDNTVSPPLKTAAHIDSLQIGENVVVVFFTASMKDGLIIAKF